ncbi:MAG TPA: 50S ribosomal protein L10 [Gemmatimonadales bacterium]|nr:50S ribosomal protein L10 [Gemmatimonadales bacterium]
MNRTEKATIVTELAGRLKSAQSVYVTDFTGLNVAQVTDLRRRLRKAGVEYVVVKNTLARRALGDGPLSVLDGFFTGSSALALSAEPSVAAKVLAEFAKEFQKPAIKGGVVDGRAVTPEQVKRLASLPPREQLLAELGAAMQAPMAGFVGALQALLTNFVGAVEALKQQREGAA